MGQIKLILTQQGKVIPGSFYTCKGWKGQYFNIYSKNQGELEQIKVGVTLYANGEEMITYLADKTAKYYPDNEVYMMSFIKPNSTEEHILNYCEATGLTKRELREKHIDIHHIDFNHANNDISNLFAIEHEEHALLHSDWPNYTPDQQKQYQEQMKMITKAIVDTYKEGQK